MMLIGKMEGGNGTIQLCKYCALVGLIITTCISVLLMPCDRTPLGRARAWLRLALMQKSLADYFRLLVDHRDDILQYVVF